MELEALARTLRAFARRMPFQPFIVELKSGSRFAVSHPEAVAFDGGLGVYVSPKGEPTLFDHDSVSQVLSAPGSQSTQAA